MACSDYSSLTDILHKFDQGRAPMDAVICPFTSDMGAGLGMAVFALFVFGALGLALAVRTKHPGPIVVAGMLSAGVVAGQLPAGAVQVMALVLFFGIAVLGLYLYQRAQSSL